MTRLVQRIALAAGGTGGHLFPAQALAETMIERGIQPFLICDQRTKDFINGGLAEINSIKIFAPRPGKSWLNKMVNFFKLIPVVLNLRRCLKQENVQAVVGFGGYPSFPTMVAALSLGLPTYIHEQNAVMGRVNRLLCSFAKKIFISFDTTMQIPTGCESKVMITGNLVRKSVAKFAEYQKTVSPNNTLTILILGGSQGSKLLTEIVPATIAALDDKLQRRLVIYQQTRPNLLAEAKKAYAKTSCKKVVVEAFFDNVGELLQQADIVVCRAGASTVTEIAMLQTPSILVPLKIARDNHQYYNAKFLVDMGGAYMLAEEDFMVSNLSPLLWRMLEDGELRAQMQNALKSKFQCAVATQMLDYISS
jgi:UDP-N-acetylglucosamine--N-acetylmuramyl-(pentapeptide) pyrophosphoryl-undecaprenol N-acetylglucosamine transferase